MTVDEANVGQLDVHGWVVKLLPWYLNGTLEPHELFQVEAHLEACFICRKELQQWRCVGDAAEQSTRENGWVPGDDHLHKVMAQITRPKPENESGNRFRLRAWLPKWLLETPVAARLAMAAQGALVVGLASLLLWPTVEPQPIQYQTYADESAVAANNQLKLRMMFDGDTTLEQVHAMLVNANASIVDGPTAFGVYTVALSGDVAVERQMARVQVLRATPGVRLAKPIARDTEAKQ